MKARPSLSCPVSKLSLGAAVSVVFLLAEGDLYFAVRLQNYAAVEKDEVVLSCELSRAAAEVRWFRDGNEIFPSKNVLLQSDGRKRSLVIRKVAQSHAGAYTCDCGTDKTAADLNIEGNPAPCGNETSPTVVPLGLRPR